MTPLAFVTSNDVKFLAAQRLLAKRHMALERVNLDLQEIQTNNGEAIARHKADQAFTRLRRPVIVTDDSWDIPGLNGFPGPFMKFVNGWLTSDDWLKLTKDLADRRIILRQHAVYQDDDQQQYFVCDTAGVLLRETRGQHVFTHTTITSFDNGETSIAEHINSGQSIFDESTKSVWPLLADWLAGH